MACGAYHDCPTQLHNRWLGRTIDESQFYDSETLINIVLKKNRLKREQKTEGTREEGLKKLKKRWKAERKNKRNEGIIECILLLRNY